MDTIFKYIDYRRFLADYYNEMKKTTRHFSYRYFAKRAGIKSPNFLKQVINGDRNLTRQMTERFLTALKLTKKESIFFRNLILFNQATTATEKQEHYTILVSMMDYINEHKLSGDQYQYFNKWYSSTVRELVSLYDFKDDYKLLAKSIVPSIKMSDARDAVQLLIRLKLIKKNSDGKYIQIDSAITSGSDMISLARREFNKKMVNLASESLDKFDINERNISCITMGISKPCYDTVVAEITAFKERLVAIVNRDKSSSRVYQFNIQLFPISEDISDIEKNSTNQNNNNRGDKK